MSLPVKHAVEARVERHAVACGFGGLHGEFAADGRPVGAYPAAVGVFSAAHVKIGGQINGLIGKIHAAGVDGIGHIAAARADKQNVIALFADEISLIADDGLRRRVGHAVDQRGKTRELGRRVDLIFRLLRIVPGNIHCAVPRAGRRPRLERQQAEKHCRAQKQR